MDLGVGNISASHGFNIDFLCDLTLVLALFLLQSHAHKMKVTFSLQKGKGEKYLMHSNEGTKTIFGHGLSC